MAELDRFSLHTGDPAPPFSLPGVDGKTHSLAEFADRRFLLVVFWCNHCPYVLGWERRLLDLAQKYRDQGVATVLINANDGVAYPDDRFERMVERSRAQHYSVPYLHDATQETAHAYGALVTPHPMLFGPDRRLIFQGRIDDHHDRPEAVQHRYLEEALDAALAGRPGPRPELSVLGCSVKWHT
jgi:peroxiredoxin